MKKKVKLITALTLLTIIGLSSILLLPDGLTRAPDVALRIIDGRQIDLKTLHGQPVLVTFWATTCIVCAREIPHLKAIYEEFSPKGLEIFGVAMAYDPPNQVLEMTKQKNIPYPIALDIDGNVAIAFGNVSSTPTSFLISPSGAIVKHNIGEMNIEELRAEIINLLLDKNYQLNQKSS